LQVPHPKSEYFKRTFLYSGTNLWNLKQISTVTTKIILKGSLVYTDITVQEILEVS
jgi:hypothetical protein